MNIKISKNTLQELCSQYDTVIINGKPTPTWSGILPYILDNIDDSYVKHINRTMPFIYGTDSDNKDVAIDFYNSTPTANALAMSDNNGCIKTNDPRQLKDCANKGYVDSKTVTVENATITFPSPVTVSSAKVYLIKMGNIKYIDFHFTLNLGTSVGTNDFRLIQGVTYKDSTGNPLTVDEMNCVYGVNNSTIDKVTGVVNSQYWYISNKGSSSSLLIVALSGRLFCN